MTSCRAPLPRKKCKVELFYCFSEFAEFFNAVHGNCFVFNSKWTTSNKTYTTAYAGEQFGELSCPVAAHQY